MAEWSERPMPGPDEFKVLWDAAIDVIVAYHGLGTSAIGHLTEIMHGIAEVTDVPRECKTPEGYEFIITKYEED